MFYKIHSVAHPTNDRNFLFELLRMLNLDSTYHANICINNAGLLWSGQTNFKEELTFCNSYLHVFPSQTIDHVVDAESAANHSHT